MTTKPNILIIIGIHIKYHQIYIKKHNILKNTFKLRKGLYQLLIISFKLHNISTIFMGLMNEIEHPYISEFE